jgi:hypothetical protein
MGNNCNHEYTNFHNQRNGGTSLLYKEEFAEADCVHCPAKNMLLVRSVGKITGIQHPWKRFDPDTCTHENWAVQEDTIHMTGGNSIPDSLVFFAIILGDGRQLSATGQCTRCLETFKIKSGFKEVWQNHERINVPTGWKPDGELLSKSQRASKKREIENQIDHLKRDASRY